MKKAVYIILIAAMTILAAGCRKDNSVVGMQLVAEGMRSGNKAMLDGLNVTWVRGESVRINGVDKTIAVGDENQAYLENVAASSVYRAIYPASLNGSAALDGDNIDVTIPDSYMWNVDGNGKQLLDVPMAGRSTDGGRLYLKHLTAAITVEIINYYGFAVLVDSVVVTSSDEGSPYQISGATSVNLASADMGITLNNSPTAAQKKVKVLFDGDAHRLKIDQGATKSVTVPVLPVGNGNRFSISVTVHKDGDANVAKTYSRTQGTGGAMGRAKLAYAGDTVGYLFTVGNNRKVIISQGNLQYQASTGTWQFAAHQYDYIGAKAGNTTAEASRAGQAAWIDLFGWGTSGWNNGNTYYMPYNSTYGGGDAVGNGYGPVSEGSYGIPLTGSSAESDWGVHNKISNGCDKKGKWRTLTAGVGSEIETLFGNRITTTTNMPTGTGSANAQFIKAIVGGEEGVIIFPDNYIHPSGIAVSGSNRSYNTTNNSCYFGGFQLNKSDWAKMEAAGAVFLPATGYRKDASVFDDNSSKNPVVYYWSSVNNGTQYAYAIMFQDGVVSSLAKSTKRYYGCAVRLVMDVE